MSEKHDADFILAHPDLSIYGYIPTRWVCYTFLGIFAASFFMHIGLAVRHRMWWLIFTFASCSLLEVAGWGGRLWSSIDIVSEGFKMQMVATIIAPTFTLAGLFIVLGQFFTRLGLAYSRMSSILYSRIFVSCDAIALVVQGAGGGIAASSDPTLGGTIMLVGIGFQLFVLTVATVVAIEYFVRYALDKPVKVTYSEIQKQVSPGRGYLDGKLKVMLYNLIAVVILLYVRAIYRTVELIDGWDGEIITTELYFNVFDAAVMVVVQYLLIIFSPGLLLGKSPIEDEDKMEDPENYPMNSVNGGFDSTVTLLPPPP